MRKYDAQMVKRNPLVGRAEKYWKRTLRLEKKLQKAGAGEKVNKEIRTLRVYKSRLMDDFADALDAMIFLLQNVYRLKVDPDFRKEIRAKKMKANQFAELVNELTKDIIPSFERIFTEQRAEKLTEGIFRTSLNEGTDIYRVKLAAVLMQHITQKIDLQLNFAMSSYLGTDLRRASELVRIISQNLEKPLGRES